MARNTKIVLGLLVVLALVLGGLFYVARQVAGAQTIRTDAAVSFATLERKKGDDDTIVTVRFNATGRVVEARARASGDQRSAYQPGSTVTICYDPEEPTSIRVAEGTCG